MLRMIPAQIKLGDSITRDILFCQGKVLGRVLHLTIFFR